MTTTPFPLSGFSITMSLYFLKSAVEGWCEKTYEWARWERSATSFPFCFPSIRFLAMVRLISSKHENTSVLLMVGRQIECERPCLSISSCSEVRLCDKRLVIVSVGENGRTVLRVKFLSFFSWVAKTRLKAFLTLCFIVRWRMYRSMLLTMPLICSASLPLTVVNLQSSFLRLVIALRNRRFRILCTSCYLHLVVENRWTSETRCFFIESFTSVGYA